MPVPFSKQALIERIKRHVANGFPNSSFTISDNEVLFLIDDAIAFAIKGAAYEGAKIEGVLVMPEAFLVTHQISALIQDPVTLEWYADLPHPPLSLPLGYSITDAYFSDSANGKGQSLFAIKATRVAYRNFMPKPTGTSFRIENNKIKLSSSNGNPLVNQNLYVQMSSPRSSDVNEVMNVPEDVVGAVFDRVVQQLLQRYGIPTDVVKDDLGAGNKSS